MCGESARVTLVTYPIFPRTGKASSSQYARTVSWPVIMATPMTIKDNPAIC